MSDDADEVKVFHSQDCDEIDAQSSDQQLAEDKKDVILEAELESRPQDIGAQPGAFSRPLPSPSFNGLGIFPMGSYSPSFLNPMLLNPAFAMMMRNPMSPNFMPMMPQAAMSPTFAAMNAMCGPGSPVYNMMAAATMMRNMSEVPLATNMRGAPLNPLSQMNQMRFPGSPISSLTNGGHMHDQLRRTQNRQIKKEDHIKKPLNAFMWFMKENRPKMLSNDAYKEKQSAELNKELGKMWRDLSQEEQQKYFEMAKKDKEDHRNRFPNWSARENYAVHKKKKRRRDKTEDTVETKKCRARFGTSRQELWCKFCKRKKKCEWATVGDMGIGSDLQDRISASGSSGPSPMASSTSAGPSPLASHHDSDSESDIDADMDEDDVDEMADRTIVNQAFDDITKVEEGPL